jgi:hypothetical protein
MEFLNMTLVFHLLDHECTTFSGKGPQPPLWVGLRAGRVQITISGVPNLNHRAGFLIYMYDLRMWLGAT